MIQKKGLSILGVIALCILAAFLSWHLSPLPPPPAPAETTSPSPVPIGGKFCLEDPMGKKWTESDFPGRYLVVYFGYTFCPDICPMALHNLTDALEILSSTGHGKVVDHLQPLFITLDPERDTPKSLGEFTSQFHPSLKGLTGSRAEIEEVAKAYRVYSSKFIPDPSKSDYLLDHSSILYVMDPKGAYVGHFNHQTSAEDMAQKLLIWVPETALS
jgi:protein SCO1/2